MPPEPSPPRQRHLGAVAVLGSSGGGTATLGHTDPVSFLRAVEGQLRSVGGYIRHALYVRLDGGKGMDSALPDTDAAALYQVCASSPSSSPLSPDWCRVVQRGTLRQVNETCRELQRSLVAPSILRNQVGGGIVLVSCHVDLFGDALRAASRTGLPATGSGGTSLSRAARAYGLRLVGNAGGSVATTPHTKAVSYAHALAAHAGIPYRPWETATAARDGPHHSHGPTATSLLNACLPAFWGAALLKFGLDRLAASSCAAGYLPGFEADSTAPAAVDAAIRALETWVLPAACAAIVATNVAGATAGADSASSSSFAGLIMASLVASSACSSSVAGGIAAGYLVARASDRVLHACIVRNVPATMTAAIVGGGVGAGAALVLLPVAPRLGWAASVVRGWILASVSATGPDGPIRALAGASWGIAACYACKVGLYHAVHLPLLLLEMETASAGGFLGAIDVLALVLVCAGICAGNLASHALSCSASLGEAEIDLCRRGLRTNLWYGDFVECCYPFMEESWIINLGGYLGSAASSGWLVLRATNPSDVPRSLAYLPLPVSILLAGKHWVRFAEACVLAAGIPFVATVLQNMIQSRASRAKKRQ